MNMNLTREFIGSIPMKYNFVWNSTPLHPETWSRHQLTILEVLERASQAIETEKDIDTEVLAISPLAATILISMEKFSIESKDLNFFPKVGDFILFGRLDKRDVYLSKNSWIGKFDSDFVLINISEKEKSKGRAIGTIMT